MNLKDTVSSAACETVNAWRAYEVNVTPKTFSALCTALRHLDAVTLQTRDLHDGAVAVLAKAGKGPANG